MFRSIICSLVCVQLWAANSVDSDLRQFVCDERVERYRGHITGSSRHLDTLTARVSFENGIEHYSTVRRNRRPIPELSRLSGAWSVGEFGTLLRESADLLRRKTPSTVQSAQWNGQSVRLLTFDVPVQESFWQLTPETGVARPVPYRASIWISQDDGKILRVSRCADRLPAAFGIAQLSWSVNLQTAEISGLLALVPVTAEYTVTYSSVNRRESNLISFGNYRRYGAESSIAFEK